MFSKNSHWFLVVRVYFFAIFSRQTRQLELEDFQKGLKNIYKKYPILKSNLEYRNFLDCLQNEGWGHDFQSSLQKCLIIFSFYSLFSNKSLRVWLKDPNGSFLFYWKRSIWYVSHEYDNIYCRKAICKCNILFFLLFKKALDWNSL